jgi:soluble lytic murein transglycosylase
MLKIFFGAYLVLLAAPRTPVERLRLAAEAYRQADYHKCAKLTAGLEQKKLKNPDAALFLQGQCRFYAGEFRQALSSFTRLVEKHPQSPHFILASHRRADCLLEMGEREKAAAAFKPASGLGPDRRTDRAVGLFHRAVSALDQKQVTNAVYLFNQLRIHSPQHPLIGSLPEEYTERTLSLPDSLLVARALHRARQWEQALAVLDEAPTPHNRSQQYQLAYRTGRILFDMRDRYPQAARILEYARRYAPSATEAEEAWFYASRARGRMDQDDLAIRSHLQMARSYPKGPLAPRAVYYAGWLELNQGRCQKALPVLRRVLTEYPESKWAKDARWSIAWCQITGKQWAAAIDTLAPQIEESKPALAGQALYWTGVAYRGLGQTKKARQAWKRTIRRFPLTWYSLLARARLGKHAPRLPRLKKAKKPPRMKNELLAKAAELTRAGLGELAVVLLRHGEKEYLEKHRSRDELLALLNAYRRAGDFNRPWFLTLTRRIYDLYRLPKSATRAVWNHSYPACQRDLLKKHTGTDLSFVLFLQAIMRTESGFDPMALSVANARGLMQMIPSTTRVVAKELGLEYDDDRLFDPDFNIRTAAWYIGRLVKKFRRQWPLAAGGYNGGAPAMMKWCQKNGHLPLDAFVESIPWTESRRYTKRVTEAFARYAYLNGTPIPRLSLKVNPDFLDDGIDY